MGLSQIKPDKCTDIEHHHVTHAVFESCVSQMCGLQFTMRYKNILRSHHVTNTQPSFFQ